MKKLISAAILSICVLSSTSVYAQRGNRENRAGRENIHEKLDLNDQQKQQMKSAYEDFRAKSKEIRENKSLTEDSKKEKSKELRAAFKEKTDNILTPEQKARMEKARKERFTGKIGEGEPMRSRNLPRNNMKPHRDNTMRHLELTDAQKEQMKSIKEKYSLQGKELKEQRKNEMKNVLTNEQKNKVKQLQKEKIAQQHKITTEGAEKFMALKENFAKEKQSIRMSRIAPDAQKEKMKSATDKYKKEVKELKEKYRL